VGPTDQIAAIRRILQPVFCFSQTRAPRLAWNRRRRTLRGGESGATLVEFAFSMPILLSLIFGLIEVCMACYTHEMISEVAREATRYAIVHGATCETGSGSSCTATASAVNTFASSVTWPNIGGGAITPNTTYPDGNEAPGSRVKVQVTYVFPLSIPFIPATHLTMSSASEMYIIQ
jgi:Flp pilus assembly protein TadG